jgi:ribosomal protein S12 methylthiotransferase accessory factor
VTAPSTQLQGSLRRLRTLVSPYTGVVGTLRESLRDPSDDRLVRIGAELAAGANGPDRSGLVEGGGGGGVDRAAATVAAIGEAVERYSASFVPEGELVLATSAELGSEAVAPERFVLFSAGQYTRAGFPFAPFREDTSVRWVRGVAVPHGDPVWLPAQLVFLTSAAAAGELPIAPSTSSGAACSLTFDEAVLAGLLELLERDAFMLAWSSRLSLPLLAWKGATSFERLESKYFAPSGLEYAAVDLSVFHRVPTVLALVRSGRPGAVAVGAACAPECEEAWRKAIAEAFAVRAWGRVLVEENCGRVDPAEVRTFADHVAYYTDPARAAAADFLDASVGRVAVEDVDPLEGDDAETRITAIGRRLAAWGAGAYAVDVTAPDVAAAGVRVVKTVVPELCPLDAAHDWRFLGGRRLYEAAWRLGLRERPLTEHDVNPFPHPFP